MSQKEKLDEVLDFTQGVRQRIVDDILKDGKIPEDRDTRNFLMTALDGLDRGAVGRAKVKLEESQTQLQAKMAGRIGHILSKINRTDIDGSRMLPEPGRIIDSGIVLTDAEIVPGEMDIGVQEANYETFMEKFDD